MSNTFITYLIATVVGAASVSLWAWLIAYPAYTAYARWWERAIAVVLSVYVLAAMLGAGAFIGALFLWNFDEIG